MKKLLLAPLVLLLLSLLFIGGCKKTKTIDVSFSSSSATVNRGEPSTVVYIDLSATSDDVVELDLKSVGSTPIKFGSYDQVFLHDDSQKCEVTVDAHAFIDTTGHLKITPGAKHIAVTFKALYDNFPHAPASYKVQITGAKNANVKSGSDVFTYNINSADVELAFASTISYSGHEPYATDPVTGNFTLASISYTAGNLGGHDLVLHYNAAPGGTTTATSLRITYSGLQDPQFGPNIIRCINTNGIEVMLSYAGTGGFFVNYDCSTFTLDSTYIDKELSRTPSPVYGTYNVLNGNINITTNEGSSFTGPISSSFFYTY